MVVAGGVVRMGRSFRIRETGYARRSGIRCAGGRAFARRHSRVEVGAQTSWHPEELVVREVAQNANMLAALQRLAVREGSEIALDFFFQTAGPDADRELAEFLGSVNGYQAVVEPDGVSGRTGR